MEKRKHHHKKSFFSRHKALKITGIVTVSIFILLLGTFGYFYNKAHSLVQSSYVASKGKRLRDGAEVIGDKKPLSILLMGTDTGALGRDYKGRTDTMMLMTLNPEKKTTGLFSIPRDTKTDIPGYPEFSPAKINAAYAFGSAGTAIQAVQNLVGNPVDYYVLINMGGMEKVINEVGGVTVTSPLTFDYEGYKFEKDHTYHMDGNKALQFSRMRYTDPLGDYGRQNRQRLVIMALIKELKKPENVTNTKLLTEFLKNVQTDMKFKQIESLLLNYRDAAENVTQDHLQGHGEMLNGQSFEVVPESERNRVGAEIAKNLQQ